MTNKQERTFVYFTYTLATKTLTHHDVMPTKAGFWQIHVAGSQVESIVFYTSLHKTRKYTKYNVPKAIKAWLSISGIYFKD